MIQNIDNGLLTPHRLTYFQDMVLNEQHCFIKYEVDTSSEAEEYDREEDQEARFVGSRLENCMIQSTDSDEMFSNLYFNRSYLNNVYINQLECYYTNLRFCLVKTLSLSYTSVGSLRFDGIITKDENSEDIQEEIPLYSADCVILDDNTRLEYLKLETFRIKHLIINTSNRSLRLILQLKDYGITKNARIDKITIHSNIDIYVIDHTGTFKDTEICKIGDGHRCKINIGKS